MPASQVWHLTYISKYQVVESFAYFLGAIEDQLIMSFINSERFCSSIDIAHPKFSLFCNDASWLFVISLTNFWKQELKKERRKKIIFLKREIMCVKLHNVIINRISHNDSLDIHRYSNISFGHWNFFFPSHFHLLLNFKKCWMKVCRTSTYCETSCVDWLITDYLCNELNLVMT